MRHRKKRKRKAEREYNKILPITFWYIHHQSLLNIKRRIKAKSLLLEEIKKGKVLSFKRSIISLIALDLQKYFLKIGNSDKVAFWKKTIPQYLLLSSEVNCTESLETTAGSCLWLACYFQSAAIGTPRLAVTVHGFTVHQDLPMRI